MGGIGGIKQYAVKDMPQTHPYSVKEGLLKQSV